MHEVWEQGSYWRKRLQRVLDLVDTPGRYGVEGQVLALDASGRRFEWMTPAAGLGGSGTAGQVTVWASASTLTGFATFTYQNAGSPNVLIQAANAAHVPLRIKLAASQTEDSLQIYSSSDTLVLGISSRGLITCPAGANQTNSIIGKGCGNVNMTGDNNMIFGVDCGRSLTTGSNNLCIGVEAGYALTVASNNHLMGLRAGFYLTGAMEGNNTFIGANAAQAATGVFGNTGIGYNVACFKTGGYYSTFYGYQSGYLAGGGYHQTSVGYYTGYKATSHYYTCIGSRALGNVTSSESAVAVGMDALYGGTNATVTNSVAVGYASGYAGTRYGVFIGYRAGYSETTDSKLYIENSDSATPLVYGEFDNDLVILNAASSKTNTVHDLLKLRHHTSGTAAAGYGVRQTFGLEDAGGNMRDAAYVSALWNDAAVATFKADVVLYAVDYGGTREGVRVRGNGSAAAVGLYGATPVVRATTGGSAATFTQGSGNAVNDASTFDGYTLGQVVKALRDIGALT